MQNKCECSSYCGSLDLIWGCMFSSKTSTILHRAFVEAANPNRKILYINSLIDNRTEEPFSTHNPLYQALAKKSNVTMKKYSSLPFAQEIMEYDNIYIDEAQFFDNLVKMVLIYVELCHKSVTVAGLVGTYERVKFGNIIDLITYADRCTQLHASCDKCFATSRISVPANFTHKIVVNSEVKSPIETGGSDKYIPVCRKHYLELNGV